MNDILELLTAVFSTENCVKASVELDLDTIHPFLNISGKGVSIRYYSCFFSKRERERYKYKISQLVEILNQKAAHGKWFVDRNDEDDVLMYFAQWDYQNIDVEEVVESIDMLIETNELIKEFPCRLADTEWGDKYEY